MKVNPLADRVLIKRVHASEKPAGRIIIPDTPKDKLLEGKVVAVGKRKMRGDGKVVPPAVRPGHTIIFAKYSGNDIIIDAEEHLVLREEEVWVSWRVEQQSSGCPERVRRRSYRFRTLRSSPAWRSRCSRRRTSEEKIAWNRFCSPHGVQQRRSIGPRLSDQKVTRRSDPRQTSNKIVAGF